MPRRSLTLQSFDCGTRLFTVATVLIDHKITANANDKKALSQFGKAVGVQATL